MSNGCSPAIDAAIRDELRQIYDPCSVAAGRPQSVLDMGLVLDWTLSDSGELEVRFCVTFPGCTLAPHFLEAARERLAAISGVAAVRTWVDTSHVWQPPSAAPHTPPPQYRPQEWRIRQKIDPTYRGPGPDESTRKNDPHR